MVEEILFWTISDKFGLVELQFQPQFLVLREYYLGPLQQTAEVDTIFLDDESSFEERDIHCFILAVDSSQEGKVVLYYTISLLLLNSNEIIEDGLLLSHSLLPSVDLLASDVHCLFDLFK